MFRILSFLALILISSATDQKYAFWNGNSKPVCACIGATKGTTLTLRRHNERNGAFIGLYNYTIVSDVGIECFVLADYFARPFVNNGYITIVPTPIFIASTWVDLDLLDFDIIRYQLDCMPYVAAGNWPTSTYSIDFEVHFYFCTYLNGATVTTPFWSHPLYSDVKYTDVYANMSIITGPLNFRKYIPIDFLLKNCTDQSFLISTDGSMEYIPNLTRLGDNIVMCAPPSSPITPIIRVAPNDINAPRKLIVMPPNVCFSTFAPIYISPISIPTTPSTIGTIKYNISSDIVNYTCSPTHSTPTTCPTCPWSTFFFNITLRNGFACNKMNWFVLCIIYLLRRLLHD